jgi:hypothetical protein
MNPDIFLKKLLDISLPQVFNPYTDRCDIVDMANAPQIRVNNLLSYLRATEGVVDSIWFARDLGYRGGRRTGLALTDEYHLHLMSKQYLGAYATQATKGPLVKERTASIIWKKLEELPNPPFLWNIFPFHPYLNDDPFSNRCHTTAERKACTSIIEELINWLEPKQIIAIGNDAHKGLTSLGIACEYVRHPSYGGQTDFENGISKIYGLSN